jgi:hypothetical protein
MIRPDVSGASSKGRKSFEKLASIAQRKSEPMDGKILNSEGQYVADIRL